MRERDTTNKRCSTLIGQGAPQLIGAHTILLWRPLFYFTFHSNTPERRWKESNQILCF